jgi:hypothetical protein
MSAYDLRPLFPFKDQLFTAPSGYWLCRLAEVSDLRPNADRLSWYLVFEQDSNKSHDTPSAIRKLEIVTSAKQVSEHGFKDDLRARLAKWLESGEDDGRVEWLQG